MWIQHFRAVGSATVWDGETPWHLDPTTGFPLRPSMASHAIASVLDNVYGEQLEDHRGGEQAYRAEQWEFAEGAGGAQPGSHLQPRWHPAATDGKTKSSALLSHCLPRRHFPAAELSAVTYLDAFSRSVISPPETMVDTHTQINKGQWHSKRPRSFRDEVLLEDIL